MNRSQWLIALVLAVPPSVGVTSAIHLSAPGKLPMAAAVGVSSFVFILGIVWLAVEYNPPLPDEDGTEN